MATIITNTDIGANLGFAGSPLKLVAREQLRGNNYIVVYGNNNTVEQNGIELVSKLNFAKISTPNGLPLSETNRMTVLVAPGVYHLAFFINWLEMDTPYIDLVSLTGDADVFLTSLNSATAIKVTTSDIKIKGFNLTEQSNNIIIEGSYSNNYFENIIGSDGSFSNGTFGGEVAGNFKNCVGGFTSFADINNEEILISSTLENCTALDFSFGHEIKESTLINCLGTFRNFGYKSITDSYLTDCTAQGDSFGCEEGIIGSTLTNCTADGFSFGRTNVPGQITIIKNSQLNNCKAGLNSFAVENSNDSSFINCVGEYESFGADKAYGIYKNCKGGDNSFGAGLQGWSSLQAGGNFYSCEAGINSFGTNFANGVFHSCIAAGGSFQGTAQGGMGGYATYTKGMNSSGAGTAIYCTDAANNPVNYGLGSTTNNI
jgi:hypothetical protein